jgi:PAS domain S-box-containing protein
LEPLAPVNILLVDDREDNLLALSAVLRSPEYRLVSATSGAEALAHLEKDDFAVVLLDVQMPGMDGLETARRMRRNSRSLNTPIILVTGMFPDEAHIRLGYEVGAVDFVPKPFDPRIMKCKVAVFAELFRKTEQIREQEKRKAAAEEIRRSRDQLRIIFERVADGIVVHGRDHRVVYANDRGAQLLGFESAEAMIGREISATGDSYYDIFDESGAVIPFERLPSRLVISGELREPELVERIRHRLTGEERWLVVSSRVVPDEEGKPYLAVTIYRDITEKKRKERNERFLADATAILASSLEYRSTLRAVARLAVDRLADWCRIELADERDEMQTVALESRDGAARAAESGRSGEGGGGSGRPCGGSALAVEASIQFRGRTLGNVSMCLHGNGARFEQEDLALIQELGRRVGMSIENALLYRDVQAQRERLQKAVAARDEFISIASHELKTPVTSLILHAEMAELQLSRRDTGGASTAGPAPYEELRERMRKYVRISVSQTDRLSRLIEEMLDVSRIGSGKLALELELIDLRRLVQGVFGEFSEQIREAGSVATFAQPSGGEIVVRCDRYRIEQVVTNLLTNALKYGAGKPIEVHLDRAGDEVCLCVRDHGIGIAPDDQTRIFERFERAVPASSVSGLGLGLYIVRQIVEGHGGSVSVQSRLGEGSEFTVRLPVA